MPRAVKLAHVSEDFHHPYRRAADPNGTAPQQHPAPQRHPAPPASTTTTPALPHVEFPNPPPTPSSSPFPAHGPPPASSPAVLLPAPFSQPQHFHACEMFRNTQGFIMNNPQFSYTSYAGSGLEQLLKYSMPAAFHDSGARYPPPKCHLGTRNDYIELITNWALGMSDRKEPILWMHGPFGIGKSAVAQSCAEALEPLNKLAATLFFSRSNSDCDDPQRVFTSIAYQIATICPSFHEAIDRCMLKDPALATKSLSKQFDGLLVQPLGQVDIAGSGLNGRVVIIDGLDECRGTEGQREIIKTIAASVEKCTTPFRWFITSRPEDSIIRTMNSPAVSLVLVSNFLYPMIREDHSLPESWPSEEALALLVERGAGLWIYVWTMVRFIKDQNSLGPKDQLRIVLEFAKEVSAKVGSDNPLVEMDFFYTLIIHQIPLKVRPTIQKILLAHSTLVNRPSVIATALCLSEDQFRHACASIQSVMKLQGSGPESMRMKFYHVSFLDFINDPQRSKDLCIYGAFLIGCRQELLMWLHKVCSCSTDSKHIVFPSSTILLEGTLGANYYVYVLVWFWKLCEASKCQFDSQTAWSLAELPFRKMLRLLPNHGVQAITGDRVRDNLTAELCDKIIRKGKCPISGCTSTKDVWILGHGENETVLMSSYSIYCFVLDNNQDPPYGQCVCGAWIQKRVLIRKSLSHNKEGFT
ncbi:hypothetical protein D9756_009844 [Leucocoprinus leucothites]|uniref:Nephrocystin 3-like N-terminal domain-containing protein n=1 Tax=Leucocoprinus leucothites TaxID=201217 RepID=A0A8H5CWD5_9AGAR|nr:hypothetical protein D9756_009844 [Leucoagaricus leucothites]